MQKGVSADSVVRSEVSVMIRWLIRHDMPEVLLIEQACFGSGAWSEEDFRCCLRQRNCIGMVAERDHQIVGYMVYELYKSKVQILNFAVHSGCRKEGIGRAMLQRLRDKLPQQRREKVVVLLPESHRNAASFFEGYEDVEIRLTEKKGLVTIRPLLTAMSRQDVDEVQALENCVLGEHGRSPRDIRELLAKDSSYGIVVRDEQTRELLGFALYGRDSKGVNMDGQFAVVVDSRYRKRGLGRKLVTSLVEQKLPITVYDIDLHCQAQCGFLRAVGVPVPKPERYVTVEWKP